MLKKRVSPTCKKGSVQHVDIYLVWRPIALRSRQIRIEYEGAIYHVLNRGDRREKIFPDDKDRQTFLKTLGEVCLRAGWRVPAYFLMGNHFHLAIETPQPTLVLGMKWFLGTYRQRFNARHRMWGFVPGERQGDCRGFRRAGIRAGGEQLYPLEPGTGWDVGG